MNEVIAKNVKAARITKNWTQQHLADAAGILLRTVQRVEKGEGASLETLGALANAFDVSVDDLRTDMDALVETLRQQLEKMRQEEEEQEFRKQHYLVEVVPVTCSAQLEAISGSDAYLMDCACKDDAARDAFADLATDLTDTGDICNDISSRSLREWAKAAYEQVKVLNDLGVVVSIGKGNQTVNGPRGPFALRTFYMLAWPKGQEESVIAVKKSA